VTRPAVRPENPEQERNARLRRADWRFLLPSPRPHRALCRGAGALADAVASIADEVIAEGADRDCDLAVAEDPDARTLTELRDALRPGGTCYTEWHPRVGGVLQVKRALRAAGFEEIACYRRWPATAVLPDFWIPIGSPGAAAYVRSRARLRGGRVRRLLTGIRRRVHDLFGARIGSPICAIAQCSAAALSAERGPAAWLREAWGEWGLGAAPDRLSTLLVTGGPRSVSKVVLLAFVEPSPVPVIAVKAPRLDEAAAGVRREGLALERLAARRSGGLPGVPRLLTRREIDGVPLLVETALGGRPLQSLLTPGSHRAWSMKVADWLAALAQGGAVLPATYWRETIVEPMFSRFVELFEQVTDRGLLREGEAIVREIGVLPSVPEQRDFGAWNVLVTPTGGLAVLDWESAEVDGLPTLDLLYYLAYASFNVDGARDRESRIDSFRRSLDPSTPVGTVRRDCLASYLDALGLHSTQLASLRALVWLIHAQSDFHHAAADAGGPPPPEALARSLFLALWSEEVRDIASR
jgi:hypothetical protein